MLQNKATYVYLIMVGLVIFSFGCNSSKQPQPYYVSGQVLDNDSGIEGVTINFSGGHESVTTSKNGVWSKSGLTGEVTITPSKEGMSFSPPSVTVNTETHGIRFKRVETRYEASGTVKDQNGQGIADVELHFNPVGLLAKTDANGNWSRDGLFGKVTIIPNKLNYRFEPSNIEISEVTHNITFTGIYDDGIPSVPIGLSATLTEDSTAYNIHLKLTWNANPEDDIARYYVWYRSDEEQYFKILRIVDGKTTSYIHKDVTKDKKRWYTISAENARGYQSDKCPPISVIPAELIPILPPPAAPTWGDSPLKTGADDEGPYSCWIELEWNEVNTRRDGSPLEDLLYYSIYTINPTDYGKTVLRHVDDVPAGSNTYRLNGLTRGATYTFVVKAVDKWKNESALSEERSIIAGGPVPKAPTLLSVNNIDNSNVEIVFSAVTENTAESGGGPVTIGEYVIYRSLNAPLNFIEIGRVKAQNPQPEQYSYIDSTVVRGDRYFYSIKAINTNFNYSDYSNYMDIKVGDFTPPSSPVWVSLETRINDDYTIDNILTFNCNQEPDLWGVYVYTRRAATTENWSLIGTVPRQEENPYVFVHSGIKNKEAYQYHLVAYDLTGNVSFSSEVRAIVSGNLYPPKAPVVTAEGLFDYDLKQPGVKLSWPEVTENDNPDEYEPVVGLAGYRIYRSYSRDYNYKLIATVPNNELNEFIDQEVVNGITYYYRVTTYNVFDQESDYCQVEVVAGDVTPPLVPEVTLVPIFNPSTPTLVTVELHIASEDEPAYYKIYRSINGIQWFLDETVERNPEGETIYSYEMTYGNTAYCRVSAVSIPGVEGPYYELEQQVLDTDPPADISAPSIVFEQTDDGNFTAVISWSYNPPEDFERYEVLYDQDNPAVIATIFDKDVKIYRVTGLKPGQTYSFAVVCADVYKLRSAPVWTIQSF